MRAKATLLPPRVAVAIAMAAAGLTLAQAQNHDPADDHHAAEVDASSDAQIKITINPEARVSVALAGSLPAPVPCGTAAELRVKILNQGFVTAQLEAKLVGDTPPDVMLDIHAEPLKGVPEELRKLHITLTKAGPTDLTISFKLRNDIPDLGGRDRVHFLMQCLA